MIDEKTIKVLKLMEASCEYYWVHLLIPPATRRYLEEKIIMLIFEGAADQNIISYLTDEYPELACIPFEETVLEDWLTEQFGPTVIRERSYLKFRKAYSPDRLSFTAMFVINTPWKYLKQMIRLIQSVFSSDLSVNHEGWIEEYKIKDKKTQQAYYHWEGHRIVSTWCDNREWERKKAKSKQK